MNKKYFLEIIIFGENVGTESFETLQKVYEFIIEQKLVAGTYKLYKAERIINEDV